jgi:hypothetical protein
MAITRKRKVFGRVRFKTGEKGYIVELTKDGIRLRQKHQRRVHILSLQQLVDLAVEQFQLNL